MHLSFSVCTKVDWSPWNVVNKPAKRHRDSRYDTSSEMTTKNINTALLSNANLKLVEAGEHKTEGHHILSVAERNIQSVTIDVEVLAVTIERVSKLLVGSSSVDEDVSRICADYTRLIGMIAIQNRMIKQMKTLMKEHK